MSCLVGRKVVNPRYKKIHPDKHYLLYGHRDDYLVPVDCGVCVNCVNKYKSAWKFRLEQEFKYMPLDALRRTYYVTMTMEPRWYGETRSHISTLIRRFLERVRKHTGKSVRHFFITERGEDEDGQHRIHLHGFLIDCKFSQSIWKYWQYGFVCVKPLYGPDGICDDFIGYVVGYITKDNDTEIVEKLDKPMVFCSKGLGKSYSDDLRNKAFHHQQGVLFPLTYSTGSHKLRSLPRYLRQKIFTEDELKSMSVDFFRNSSEDVIPDPPYYIGRQQFNDYTLYKEACSIIYNQYKKLYGKQSFGAIYESADSECW